MLQLIFATNRKMYYRGNKERRTNEKNRITPPWRKYLEQRQPFTGWTDVDLTEKGIADANQAGILLKRKRISF